jgi:carbonic anhydrase/acetyltransferase-like protein (isoleucine patch superfamily)
MKNTFIASSAIIKADVELKENANIWYGAVLRGDRGKIVIGENTNVQDNVVLHGDGGRGVILGDCVTVGHCAVVHASTVANNCLIGMNATVLSFCTIGEFSIIGAGSLIPPGKTIPSRSVVMGVPGKVVREITPDEEEMLKKHALSYVTIAEQELGDTSYEK